MVDRIRVPFRASRALLLVTLSAHLVAAAGLYLAGAAFWIALCGYACLGASAAWRIRGAVRNFPSSRVLELAADRSCAITGASAACRGLLRADSIALPWLVVLRIDCTGTRGARSIVLLPDSAGAEDWRRLRVFLRWGVRFAAAAPTPSDGPN